jgi:hypothetical protein
MLKDAGDRVYKMIHIDVAWFCVCASWAVQTRGMNVRFKVVVGECTFCGVEGYVCLRGCRNVIQGSSLGGVGLVE